MPQSIQREVPELEAEDRMRQVRRLELLNDVPHQLRSSLSSGSSGPALVRRLQPEERHELMEEDDEEMPRADAPELSGLDFGAKKKKMFEELSKSKMRPSRLIEAELRSSAAKANQRVKTDPQAH